MLTWSSEKVKMQRLAKTSNADDLIQLEEDWNTGYHLFNQKNARYYYREQKFADLKAGQQIYQTPINAVRVIGMTAQVTATYFPPLTEIPDEFEWRLLTSYQMSSSWPTKYFNIGNDEYGLWPTPSQTITNGIRYYYQMQDFDMSIDDVATVSNNQYATLATGITVTVNNGSTTVTASSSVFTSGMVGLSFRLNGVTDLTWYEIIAVTNGVTLTLKQAFVGSSGSGFNFQIGQTSIIPQEYQDAPMHYALGNYFSAQGNEERFQFHLGSDQDGKRGVFYSMALQCMQDYSSSSQSNVIAEGDEVALNIWAVPPNAAP